MNTQDSSFFSRYILVGVINTLIGYSLILVLELGLGVGPVTANATGYGVGFLVSYLLNRGFAFKSRGNHRKLLPAFAAAALASYGLNLLTLHITVAAGWPTPLAQGVAVATYTASFYLLNRYWVFRAWPTGPSNS